MSARKSAVPLADAAAAAGLILLVAAGWWVMTHGLEGQIPLHFGLDGHADRWGDRTDAARGLWMMAAALAALSGLTLVLERQGGERWRDGLRLARGAISVAFVFLGLLFTGLGMGWIGTGGPVQAWVMALVSVVLLVVGVPMGRARPNPVFGVRTFWTLTSRLSWDKTNRLGGRLFCGIGLFGLFAAPFAPQPLGMQALIGAVLVSAALVVLESWRVWARDPDRRAGREPAV